MEKHRATRALIHLGNLRQNIDKIRKSVREGTIICASVKAEAYGHGILRIPGLLRELGVQYLGVATPWEGELLRKTGDRESIILFGPSSLDEIPTTINADLQPMVTDARYLNALTEELIRSERKKLSVHLKVDTGMGRVGCKPTEALQLARQIIQSPLVELAGLATHFPVADSARDDDMAFTRKQMKMLQKIADEFRAAGIDPGILHAANSGGIAMHPDDILPDMMIRPGIAMYGYGPALPGPEPQKPVMELRTKITALKKIEAGDTVSYGRTWKAKEATWIATIPVGYADGYSRLLSNKAEVLIAGSRYPIVGTVCMDQCMVNLGSKTGVKAGDDVVLFGPDPAGPDAEEIAGLMGTISYEVTCGISGRVPRIYTD